MLPCVQVKTLKKENQQLKEKVVWVSSQPAQSKKQELRRAQTIA
jgi:hypothetical protein